MNLRSFLDTLTAGGKTALISTGLGMAGLLGYGFLGQREVVYLPLGLSTVVLASAFLGGLQGGMAVRTMGWLHGGIVAAFYLLLVFSAGALVFPAAGLRPSSLLLAAGLLAAGSTGGVIGINLRFWRGRRMQKKWCGMKNAG